jgi:hypothetical protein
MIYDILFITTNNCVWIYGKIIDDYAFIYGLFICFRLQFTIYIYIPLFRSIRNQFTYLSGHIQFFVKIRYCTYNSKLRLLLFDIHNVFSVYNVARMYILLNTTHAANNKIIIQINQIGSKIFYKITYHLGGHA